MKKYVRFTLILLLLLGAGFGVYKYFGIGTE